jgi:hypothetical protein
LARGATARYRLGVERPSSERPAANGAKDAPTETNADRIRRRIANNRVGALIVVGIGLISTIGGAIGGGRQIVNLFHESSGSPKKSTTVHLNPAELKTAKNSRYGFSFQYPVTWDRQDPVNGDGLMAAGPQPGLELVGYGALPTSGPSPDDPYARLQYQADQLASGSNSRIVEAPTQQNVTRFLPGGDATETAGYRFVMQKPGVDGAPAVTTVAITTTTSERDVTMLCKVPTGLSSSWRGACNQLISTLTLTR